MPRIVTLRNTFPILESRLTIYSVEQALKELTSRSQDRNTRQVMENVKGYIRGWMGYFYVADKKRILQSWNEWLHRRMRMYIWKPPTRCAAAQSTQQLLQTPLSLRTSFNAKKMPPRHS